MHKSFGEQKAEIRSFLAKQYRGKPLFHIIDAIAQAKAEAQKRISELKKADAKSPIKYELTLLIKACDELTAEFKASTKPQQQ